jgi:Trk-type K+ transport system membrane component
VRQLEYIALKKLIWIILIYIFSFYILGIFMLSIYVAFQPTAKEILQENGDINPFWWALFHTISAFNNAGFSLFATNLIPFNYNWYILLIISTLSILGNTGYPIILRLIVWICRRFSKNFVPYKLLLVKPRSLVTHIFPATDTRIISLIFKLIT